MRQKILKAFIDFHSILDPIWAPNWTQKSIQNRKKYVLKAPSEKHLKNIPFQVENRRFQNGKI